MSRIQLIGNYNSRPSNIRIVNKKYFFALEGIETERKYLKELIATTGNNTYVFYLYHSKDFGSTNLYSLVTTINDVLTHKDKFQLMIKDMANIIFGYLANKRVIINATKLKSHVSRFAYSIRKKDNDAFTEEMIEPLISFLKDKVSNYDFYDLLVEGEIEKVINEETEFYEGIDEIIVVGDRDNKSFVDKQYDKVLEIANKRNITFILTNPCIEFWFLLHHTDCKNIDMSKWNEGNPADFVFDELKKYDPKYTKTSVDVNWYIDNVGIGIKNSMLYTNDLVKLKYSFGTNMPKFIDKINEIKDSFRNT